MSEYQIALWLIMASAAASFINMMAGGGSMITLGVMIMLGMDPSVANGTNRIGVLVGTGTGAATFLSEKESNIKESIKYAVWTIPGAFVGSFYSIQISNTAFQQILSVIMILVLITLFIPKKRKESNMPIPRHKWILYPSLLIIGFYGGFIQVGVGFLLMAVLRHVMHLNLVKTNMHKVFIVMLYTLPILLVFGLNDKIHWFYAISMSIGNAIGSWVSVKLSIRKGDKFVKLILVIATLLMAIKLFMSSID